MSRTHFSLVLIAALFLTAPLAAAPPFGSFGGKVGGGNGGAGVIPLHGWALDDLGVDAVDILVDGRVVGRAHYGRSRPGVTDQYPAFPDSAAPGFAFELDSTRFLNGLHQVWARVTSSTGEVVDLNRVVLEFTNLTHNLVPFGPIELPNADAELLGNCNVNSPNRRLHVVWGYALDVGVEIGDQGVGYVELLLDGSILASSLTSCFFDPALGGLVNCYGVRRLDVRRVFPHLPEGAAVHSGFRFIIDPGFLIAAGYSPGRHVLTIRAGDIAGQVANIDEIPVFFSCDNLVANEGSFGEVRRPRGGLIHQGTIEANGWALDFDGVNQVIVHVDGVNVGLAQYGLPRPGVSALYPGYPNSALPGWRFFLDTTTLSNGDHTLQVLVRDLRGAVTMIGERRFVVLNNP